MNDYYTMLRFIRIMVSIFFWSIKTFIWSYFDPADSLGNISILTMFGIYLYISIGCITSFGGEIW